MENLQEKLKTVLKLGQKAFAVEFQGELYFIVESGYFGSERHCNVGKDFYLFDKDTTHIGILNLGEIFMSEQERAFERFNGVLEAPAEFYMLTEIQITKSEYKGKHLGDFLLNWGMRDVEKISEKTGGKKPILFIRENTKITIPFYKKWGAELNQDFSDDTVGSSCYMIIKDPKSKAEYSGKILAEQTKQFLKDGRDK